MYRCCSFLVCLVLLLLAACGDTAADNDAPVKVVQDFVQSVENRDLNAAIDLIEPTDVRREMLPELTLNTNQLGTLEFRDDTYTLQDNDGKLAHVNFKSNITYGMQGIAADEQVLETVFELVHTNGRWYIRNMKLTSELPNP